MRFLLLRSTPSLTRPSLPLHPGRITLRRVRPYSQQSYGGEDETGHPKSDQPNPKADLEHPGPPSPADKGKNTSSSSSSESRPSSSKESEEGSKPYQETSQGGRPAIYNPGSASEDANEEVRKHNEEIAKAHDRPVNQIDEDGKVEKEFWKDKTGR